MPTSAQAKTHAQHHRLGHALCRGEGATTPHAVLVTCPRCLKLIAAQALAKRKNIGQGG